MIYQIENSFRSNHFECIRYRDLTNMLHFHRHFELAFVLEGEMKFYTGESQETIRPGECAMILSNELHSYETVDTSLCDICIFSEDYVPLFASQVRGFVPSSHVFHCNDSVMKFAKAELFRPDKMPGLYSLKAALYAVAGAFLDTARLQPRSADRDGPFNQLMQYISENYTEDISLKQAAGVLGYEHHYLSRCFHNHIPMTFPHYVNQMRVDSAAELLRGTQLSISEIALNSGFQSIRSFNRIYREFTGKAPREERMR